MTQFTSQQKKILALSNLGGALEFYDFIVFVFLAKNISNLFFPAKSPILSLIITYSVFAVGYLARPLGGIIFGHIGDRYGRKKTFIATLLLMALPTFLIGLLPTYQTAGIFASIILIILRLIQGFSVGGEIPGAVVFSLETVMEQHRGFATGLILFGVNMGLLSGSLIVGLLSHYLTKQQMLIWGWRIPFLLGGIFGITSAYLRKQLQETPAFRLMKHQTINTYLPLKKILLHHFKPLIKAIAITALQAVIISVIYLFMPTYLSTFFHYPLEKTLALNTFTILLFAIPILLTSYLSDVFGRRNIVLISILAYLFLSYPLFLLFKQQNWNLVILALSLLALFASPVAGCFSCLMAEQFPTPVRYSGTALAYNLGFGIIGGFTPLFVTWLIHVTGNVLAPSYYLMAISAIALIAWFYLPETHKSDITKN
jgi:MFS family permease